MALKKLGSTAPVAVTNTTVYTVPTGMSATMNISICNGGPASAKVRVSIGPTVPTNVDFIEYDSTIVSSGVLERTGIIASAGESVVVYTDVATISVRVHGVEE